MMQETVAKDQRLNALAFSNYIVQDAKSYLRGEFDGNFKQCKLYLISCS